MHPLLYGCEDVCGCPMEVAFTVCIAFVAFAAEYCVSLPCARLAVGKEGRIMPIKDRLDQMSALLIDFLLRLLQEDMVEPEYLLLAIFALDGQGGLVVHRQDALHF